MQRMERREFFFVGAAGALTAQDLSRSGFAEADITPAIGSEIPGNYFKQFHKTLHDPCKVRAAYFEHAGQAVWLIGIDSLIVPRHVVEKVRTRLASTSILIGASHSHSSGPVGMVQPGEYDHASPEVREMAYGMSSAADPAYLDLLENQIVEAARQASRNARASLWGYGEGKESAAIFNRRIRMKNGLTFTHPRPGNPDMIEAAGPVDPAVTVLGVFDETVQLIGCVVNYACHATTNPGGISANWIHYLERAIRRQFGTGVVVVYLGGFAGDVTQVDNFDETAAPRGDDYARLIGGRVGAEANKVLLSMKPSAPAPIQVAFSKYVEGRRIPSAERLAKSKAIVAQPRGERPSEEWTFAKEIVLLDALLAKQKSVEIELQAIAIGPMLYLAAPGEIFAQLGLDIRKASRFAYNNPVSLANGCVGYIPTREAFDASGGGYEQRLTSYTNLVPEAGPRLVRKATALMSQLRWTEMPKVPKVARFNGPWDYGNKAPDVEALSPKQPMKLFNGLNTEGWSIWLRGAQSTTDTRNVFRVESGVLRISGEDWGGLTTLGNYRDYRLVTQWRWGTTTWGDREKRARDSGILIHAIGPDNGYNNTWPESYESQIIEGGAGDILVVSAQTAMTASCFCRLDGKEMYFDPTGPVMTREKGRINWYGRAKDWKDQIDVRGPRDMEKRRGEWNRQEVIAHEDMMVNLVNNKVVSAAFELSQTQGRITVQSEGAEIFFRRIELLPLTDSDRRLARQLTKR
jgi:hypothetical protein